MATLTADQAATLKAYIESGHCAHLYPRKKTITLQGWRVMDIPTAVAEMKRQMDKHETEARVRAGLAACRGVVLS